MQDNIKTTTSFIKERAQKVSVLYVEDEEFLRNQTASLLNKLFKNVDIAVDGKDGLDKYFQNKYDIVITDLSMPNMNGLELISNIRKKNLHQIIIIMSAHKEPEDMGKVEINNEIEYIYKPVEMNQMLKILSNSIERLNTVV